MLLLLWHLTLCDPMDISLPGSSVHGISQPRILGWVVISFSKGSSWPRDWTHVSFSGGKFCFNTEPPGKPRVHLIFCLNKWCMFSKEIVEKVRKRKWGDTSLALMTLRLFHANLTPRFLSGSYYHSGFEAIARWSQTEQLEFVPCGQLCQNTDVKEKLSPAQIKR